MSRKTATKPAANPISDLSPTAGLLMPDTRPDASLDGDVVPDGDFAGMRVDDVLAAMTEGLNDVLGDASIEVAGCALDSVLAEYLAVVQMVKGDAEAKISGLRYIETALPYASLPVQLAQPYGSARKILGHRKASK